MLPWQQEALLRPTPRLVCQGCGEAIWYGEQYLDLEAFGLRGVACEACLRRHTHG